MVKKRLQFLGITIISGCLLSIESKSPPIREKNEKLRRISNQHFQQTELSNADNDIIVYIYYYICYARTLFQFITFINCPILTSSFIEKHWMWWGCEMRQDALLVWVD